MIKSRKSLWHYLPQDITSQFHIYEIVCQFAFLGVAVFHRTRFSFNFTPTIVLPNLKAFICDVKMYFVFLILLLSAEVPGLPPLIHSIDSLSVQENWSQQEPLHKSPNTSWGIETWSYLCQHFQSLHFIMLFSSPPCQHSVIVTYKRHTVYYKYWRNKWMVDSSPEFNTLSTNQ